MLETNQQIGGNARQLPEHEQHQQVVRQHHPKHRGHERQQKAVHPPLIGVAAQVAPCIDDDECPHAGNDKRHHQAQTIQHEGQIHPQRRNPCLRLAQRLTVRHRVQMRGEVHKQTRRNQRQQPTAEPPGRTMHHRGQQRGDESCQNSNPHALVISPL